MLKQKNSKNKKKKVIKINLITIVILYFFYSTWTFANDWVYTIKKGDNLWNLTANHLIDISYVKKIQILNNIADPWHILPGTQITIPSAWIRKFPALVRVQNLQGTAKVLQEGMDQFQVLVVGGIVVLGDTIITDENSTLILGFLDGSKIMLEENSHLTIDHLMLLEHTEMSDTRLHLKSGRLETLAATAKGSARRFDIKTPATVTSVRGTDYRVSAEKEQQQSRTEVIAGAVAIEGGNKKIMVPAGFGTVTLKDKEPLPPVKLMPSPDIRQLPKLFNQIPIQFVMPKLPKGHGYRVQVALTSKFLDVLIDKTINSDAFRGPNLADGLYHMRVRVIDENKLEGYSAETQIIVNALPETPFLVSPQPGQGILIEDNPEFLWSGSEKVTQYHLQIAKDMSFSQLLIDQEGIESTEFELIESLALGKYYWRIAGIDKEGDGPFSDGRLFRRILPAPALEDPEISEDTMVIRAREGLPGQKYHFQVAADSEFKELIIDQQTNEPGIELSKPESGEYFIRLRTIDADGFIGPFGSTQSFKVPYNYYWLLTLLPLLALIAL